MSSEAVTGELSDQAEREIIRTSLDRNLFVEAGAGTGKTSELVQRIVALVGSGRAEIGEVVAITFTDAAAGELRERVRHAFELVVADETTTKERRAACQRALDEIAGAPIQTIHSFARRLLHAHGTSAGIPPVFDVADSVQARLNFERRWHTFLATSVASRKPIDADLERLLRTGIALGLRVSQLRELALQLEDSWHRLKPVDASNAIGPEPKVDLTVLIGLVKDVVGMRADCDDATNALALRLSSLVPWRSRLVAARESGTQVAMIEALLAAPPLKAGQFARGAWRGESATEASERLTKIAALTTELLNGHRQSVLSGVLRLLTIFVLMGVDSRRRSGELSFQDLLVYARNLLRDHPSVLRSLQHEYRYVFVDEFQDTDSLQAEIVGLLTKSTGSLGRPGTLFAVGDPRQSIYRFRQADLNQYLAFRRRLGDDAIALRTNFRTLPGVMEWINGAFSELLAGVAEEGSDQLRFGRTPGDMCESGSVTLVGGGLTRGTMTTPALRNVEANELVALLRRAKEQSWPVSDNGERSIRYGDMAVLMPSRVALPALERAMRGEGVPYRIESRSLIWATQEIRDTLSILGAVADTTNERAVIAALRCPGMGCRDTDLLSWRASGRSWNYSDEQVLADEHPVARAFATLIKLNSERNWKSVPELVVHAINAGHLYESAFANSRPREAWNRLRFLTEQASTWFGNGGSGLYDFLEWCRVQAQEGGDGLESILPDADDDAVRVMTIHAAKGLEFPMVMLTGLNSTTRAPSSARVLWDGNCQTQMRIGPAALGWETPDFRAVAEAGELADQQEQLRLLYVGATRARDHLVIGVHHLVPKTAESRTLAASLLRASEHLDVPTLGSHRHWDAFVSIQPEPPPRLESQPTAGAGTTGGVHGVAHSLEARAERRRRTIEIASTPTALAATTVTRLVGDHEMTSPGQGVGKGEVTLPVVSGSRGPDDLAGRLAFGSAVHWALEKVDINAPSDLDHLARLAAGREAISHRNEDVLKSLRLAVDSKPLEEARLCRRSWKEVFVANTVGNVVLEGFIDLLYERNDGLVIIDYKTDAVGDASAVPALLDRYQWQLATYALAIESTLKRPVIEAALLMVSPSCPVAIHAPLENLVAVQDQLVASIGGLTKAAVHYRGFASDRRE